MIHLRQHGVDGHEGDSERIAAIADDLQKLGRHRTTAIAGAGASAAVSAQLGIRLLAGDPVTAARGVAVHG